MENSRIIAVRDILISKFSPKFISYEYPYWTLKGKYPENKDILSEINELFPDIIIEGFAFKKKNEEYIYLVKFSFPEDKDTLSEIFNSFQEDDEE
jgi:hypothetical protein